MSRARDIADLGGSADAGTVTGSNLIINGDMAVAQRGTSSTTSGYKTVDRWSAAFGGTGAAVTQSQESLASSDEPYALGFRKYFRSTVTGTSTATDAYHQIYQYIEAQNMAQSGWNFTSSSSYITLSFWVRSSLAGTYVFYVQSMDGTAQAYSHAFTLSANTWTKVTKTISGNSNITINNDNGHGLLVDVLPHYGTAYTTASSTEDAWKTSDGTDVAKDFAQNWLNTSSATFDLTGFKLEVGTTVTPFQHESFADNLRKCQRYYCKSYDHEYAPGNTYQLGAIFDRFSSAVSNRAVSVQFPVTMRDNPTVTLYSLNGTSGSVSDTGTGYTHVSDDAATINGTIGETGFSKLTNIAAANMLAFHYTAESEL